MEVTEIINTLTSKSMNWVLIGVIVGCILLLMLFRWSLYKWLKWFYFPTMTVALLFIGIGALGGSLITKLLSDTLAEYNTLIAPFIKNLTFNFIRYGIILLVISVVTIAVDILLKKRMSKTVIN